MSGIEIHNEPIERKIKLNSVTFPGFGNVLGNDNFFPVHQERNSVYKLFPGAFHLQFKKAVFNHQFHGSFQRHTPHELTWDHKTGFKKECGWSGPNLKLGID